MAASMKIMTAFWDMVQSCLVEADRRFRGALPNFMIEWLTLLFRIREVLISNLDTGTGYTD
jgi:hypothetical protein